MTDKEAIEEIKSLGLIIDVMTHGVRRRSIYAALNLAINALEEGHHDDWITELIEELESRKSYGVEYAQAMEDVITILEAKFGADKEDRE